MCRCSIAALPHFLTGVGKEHSIQPTCDLGEHFSLDLIKTENEGRRSDSACRDRSNAHSVLPFGGSIPERVQPRLITGQALRREEMIRYLPAMFVGSLSQSFGALAPLELPADERFEFPATSSVVSAMPRSTMPAA
ncbi:hypothetical protein C7441_1109 [Pseudaminobacter salicylatoxidans]|uniref:Uncharacterized protein n=1 Tax=Pseudaminobacter salicylatoxidans TaxID=93369 RepID=A0A316C4Z6_PSESE|nr:hypothetical protein C7441_1109 [Pseudaminobacter salicylatoxidans]